ncbi:MAG: SGNH/GDSL hydrolase family protein [Chitinophagaceae bacterium]
MPQSAPNNNPNTIPATAIPKYTYLALGDSYTIGQSVPASDNFPSQAISILNKDTVFFEPARIVATTGWTTDELDAGITSAGNAGTLLPVYKFVSLLIGVNDQYRGRSVESYKPAFEDLLKRAIHFAGDLSGHVVVLSIPDWSVTPFASGRNREEIARQIDAYNLAIREIAQKYNVAYIDITPWTREAATDLSLIAGDGLHPSAKEYKRWAERITAFFKTKI